MKEFIFVSDFDGTLTKRDFYKILADKYLNSQKEDLYRRWNNGEFRDYEMLDLIYSSVNESEEELLDNILSIQLDSYFLEFVNNIKNSGGDFLILSAGTSYYIEKFLQHMGINDIPIVSNKGVYKDNSLHLVVDKESPYFSDIFGIDKGKFVFSLRDKYEKIFFAGDSKPDISPAQAADIAFATGKLKGFLSDINVPFISFNDLTDINKYLKSIGVIKNG